MPLVTHTLLSARHKRFRHSAAHLTCVRKQKAACRPTPTLHRSEALTSLIAAEMLLFPKKKKQNKNRQPADCGHTLLEFTVLIGMAGFREIAKRRLFQGCQKTIKTKQPLGRWRCEFTPCQSGNSDDNCSFHPHLHWLWACWVLLLLLLQDSWETTKQTSLSLVTTVQHKCCNYCTYGTKTARGQDS